MFLIEFKTTFTIGLLQFLTSVTEKRDLYKLTYSSYMYFLVWILKGLPQNISEGHNSLSLYSLFTQDIFTLFSGSVCSCLAYVQIKKLHSVS